MNAREPSEDARVPGRRQEVDHPREDEPGYRGGSLARRARAHGAAVDAACVAAGAALPLAFAPFGLFPVAFASLAVLFLAWRGCRTPRRACLRGWLFGIGSFGAGMSWIYESFGFAQVPGALAFVLTVGLVGCLALYPAALGWIVARVAPAGSRGSPRKRKGDASRLLAVYPAAWMLGEWLRGWALTGFTWLQIGYAQIDAPAAGWLPVAGVYGAGALAAFVAGALAWALIGRDRRAFILLGGAAVLWGTGAVLARVEWTRPAGLPVEVAIVQGNVAQDRKWRPEMRERTLDRYAALTRRHFDADLVVWPESAMPGFLDTLEAFTRPLAAEAAGQGSAILTGVPTRRGPDGPYLNSVAMLGPGAGVYHKRRLVPFGEYLPLAPLIRPVVEALGIRMADFSPGPRGQAPLRIGPHVLGVSICYEIAFGEEVRRALPEAALLVTVSNDAWFGDSIGPHQHLEMARARAAETGRWLVRSTNTGLSAVVSPRGAVEGGLPQFQTAAETFEVVPMRGETPWVRIGDAPIVTVLALWFAAGAVRARRFPVDPPPY